MNTHRRPDCFRLIRVAQTSVCGGLQPNAAYFFRTWDSAFVVGRTPWGVPSGPRDAPVPLPGRRIKSFHGSTGRPGGRSRTRASAPLRHRAKIGWSNVSNERDRSLTVAALSKCACRAARVSKRLGLNAQVIPPRLLINYAGGHLWEKWFVRRICGLVQARAVFQVSDIVRVR